MTIRKAGSKKTERGQDAIDLRIEVASNVTADKASKRSATLIAIEAGSDLRQVSRLVLEGFDAATIHDCGCILTLESATDLLAIHALLSRLVEQAQRRGVLEQ